MISFSRLVTAFVGCLCAATGSAAAAANLVTNGDFESGLKGWKTFNAKAPAAGMSRATEARRGRRSVKVEATAKRRNEGIRTEVKGLDPENIYVISAWVKGFGYCALFAFDGKWTYGPRKKLTDEWQKLEIRKFITGKSMNLHIVSDTNYEKAAAVFWVDDVQVIKRTTHALPDAEVAAAVLQAQAYAEPGKHVKIVTDRAAIGGAYVRGDIRWIYLARGVPFPQTARPVHVYVRAWTSSHETHTLSLSALDTNQGALSLPASEKWAWARFEKPLHARRVGDTFYVTVSGDEKRVETRLDAIVLSTRADLAPDDLATVASREAAMAERGLLRIATISNPPRIDGILTDGCWQGAVAAMPFVRRGQRKGGKAVFPRDGTTARLCYDAKSLYVAFRCKQEILKPENNRLGDFRKAVTARDSREMWRDDSVLLLLDTNLDRKGFFEFMVNGLGTLLDGRCPPEAPWKDRDRSWESGADVRARAEDGCWTVEARIPLKSLGATPKQGDRWGVGLGRINMTAGGKGEYSTWQPMEGGFHNAEEFGLLEFGREAVGAGLADGLTVAPGENAVRLRLHNPGSKPMRVRLGAEIAREGMKHERTFSDYSLKPGKGREPALKYDVSAEGDVAFRHAIQDPATLTNYYRSPRYLMRVESSTITITVAAKGAYTLFLNGEAVGKGQGGEKRVTRPLYQGINVIAVQTRDRNAKVTCETGEQRFGLDTSWRFSQEEGAEWNATAFDDRAWPQWDPKKAARGRIFLRKNLLFRHSKLWPPNGGIHVPLGATTSVWHWLDGIKGMELSGYTFFVEVPEGMEMVGATGFDQVRNVGNAVREIQTTETVRDGTKYRRYAIRFDRPVVPPSDRWKRYFYSNCYLGIRALKDPGKDARVYYYVETDRFAEVPNSEKIVIYPRLKGKAPEFHLFICRGGTERYGTSAALEGALAETMSQCGFTHYTCKKSYADKYGMKNYASGAEWVMGLMMLKEADPKFQRFDEDGKPYKPVGWCPSLLQTEEARKHLVESYARSQKNNPLDVLDWDMESNPFTGRAACFCSECLPLFREFAELAEDVKLDCKIIEGQYREKWIEFQCSQAALTASVVRDVVKEHNPDTVFSAYSAYQSEENRAHYSIDWRLLGAHVDVACCGYGRRPEEVAATLDALAPHGVPLLAGLLLDCPYESMQPPHPHQTRKVEVIRRVLDARGGVFFMTPNRGMDARSYVAFAETTRFIADYETFFIARDPNAEFVTEKNLPDDDCIVLRNGHQRVVLLLNNTDRARAVDIRLAEAPRAVRDYYAERDLAPDAENRLNVVVAPYDFAALICE